MALIPHELDKGEVLRRIQKERIISGQDGPTFIGVCGGTASGKSSICDIVMRYFTQKASVALVNGDNFYRVLSEEEHEQAQKGNYNFDHPNAIDFELMFSCLSDLKAGRRTAIPTYSYVTHKRTGEVTEVQPADVILVEGIYVFFDKRVVDLFDLKVFVDVSADERLSRRIVRDVRERGRTMESVIFQYLRFVKMSHDQYIEPCKAKADIIIPRGLDNVPAISLIIDRIANILSITLSCVSSPSHGAVSPGHMSRERLLREAVVLNSLQAQLEPFVGE